MFELINNTNSGWYNICVDGVTYLYSQVHYYRSEPRDRLHFVSKDKEVTNSLLKSKINAFGNFDCISMYDLLDWIDYEAERYVSVSHETITIDENGTEKNTKTGRFTGYFEFIIDLRSWKKSYSFNEYFEILQRLGQENKFISGQIINFPEDGPTFNISFLLPEITGTLGEAITPYMNEFRKVHEKAIMNLELKHNEKSIIESFKFPESIKFPCEQYLLYFAQFLQDLGINATSNLKEEAGKVLFSVTPTDDVEALDKIREALAVYLNLPASPIVYDDSFAAMRLQQQIENLQYSQRMVVRELQFNEKLLIAQSETIREKNITISQQQSVIEQKDKIIEKISSKSIMMDSAENKEELEEIYDGVRVGESEALKKWLGISLNPAKAIKMAVKNTFGKDEKKSILGLDED